jgi:hypothetical protein
MRTQGVRYDWAVVEEAFLYRAHSRGGEFRLGRNLVVNFQN